MGSQNSNQNENYIEITENESIDPYLETFTLNSPTEPESSEEKSNDDQKRYFVTEPLETQESSYSIPTPTPVSVPLNLPENQKKISFKVAGRKRGRKSNNENTKEKRPPRKNDRDNIQSKVQVHYMTFIVNYQVII